ncbi:PadR family transcriptional regulator [Pelagibacterium lacus]|uniref:PadR family transcriptional regulator n=1 Tax=Pelagibacterium lacus TaxID=2282655 RepID=UPI0018F5A3AF|nr:PadR family transcriptional regulator [Pelagibacterium lacus]
MNVRTLCLSILHSREASGYEIRKLCTEGNGSYFVEASFGSIYPALAKLEEEELVTSRVEHQPGKPSKKIYAITEAGRIAFIDALHEPLGEDVFRSPFLLFALFANLVDADLVEERVKARIAELDVQIAELRRMQAELDDPHCQTEHDSPANGAWVLRYGLACLEVARAQLHSHMDSLIATARPSRGVAQAAE